MLVLLIRLLRKTRPVPLRDEIVLIAPALLLLITVSSQREFNIHLRYVFPTLGLALVFLGQSANFCLALRFPIVRMFTVGFVGWSVVSSLSVYPHQLAYFNDFVGGPRNGYKHLLGSSLDWGQGWLSVQAMSDYGSALVLASPAEYRRVQDLGGDISVPRGVEQIDTLLRDSSVTIVVSPNLIGIPGCLVAAGDSMVTTCILPPGSAKTIVVVDGLLLVKD